MSWLLKLSGRGSHDIICPALEFKYLDGVERQESYAKSHKLINGEGKRVCITPPSKRKMQRSASYVRLSKTMDKIARSRGWTFTFLTITLPGQFHCNPKFSFGNNYSGAKPQEILDELNKYWQLIGSQFAYHNLYAYKNFFGFAVKEAHKSGVLHQHVLMYHSKQDSDLIHKIVRTVEAKQREKYGKLKWDIKLDNGTARASTYLFKYISPDTNNKNVIKNDAIRNLYGCKAISHFGFDGSIKEFEHLVANYLPYKKELPADFVDVLERRDLYKFLMDYRDCCKAERINVAPKKYKFLGVTFKAQERIFKFENDNLINLPFKNYYPIEKNGLKKIWLGVLVACNVPMTKEVLIEKKNFVIIEMIESDCEDLDLFEENLGSMLLGFKFAQVKQEFFSARKLDYIFKQSLKHIDVYVPELDCMFSKTNFDTVRLANETYLAKAKSFFLHTIKTDYYNEYFGLNLDTLDYYFSLIEPNLIFSKAHLGLMPPYSSGGLATHPKDKPKPEKTKPKNQEFEEIH